MYKYTKITREEIEALDMTSEAAVYFIMKLFMGKNGVAYPTSATISNILNISVRSVQNARRKLLKKGLIVRDGYESKTGNARYKLGVQNLAQGCKILQGGGEESFRGGGAESCTHINKKEKEKEVEEEKSPNILNIQSYKRRR